jgi:hypothetical protein
MPDEGFDNSVSSGEVNRGPVNSATRKMPRFRSIGFSTAFTGSDSSVTDYLLEVPAKCPYCRQDIKEKTLIEPK